MTTAWAAVLWVASSVVVSAAVGCAPQVAQGGDPRGGGTTIRRYPWHEDVVTTVFWVGEAASPDNGGIHNRASAWDTHWQRHFGGVDDPAAREGYWPRGFVPQENPFYVALPYDDFAGRGGRRSDFSRVVYWAAEQSYAPDVSALKNRWLMIRSAERVCYGQWEDVGPYREDDAAYVFGSAPPANRIAPDAGLDVSPALRDCLHLDGGLGRTAWRFIEASDVPPGAWSRIVTRRNRLP